LIPSLLAFDDRRTKPEERASPDPEDFSRGNERRGTGARFVTEGHKDKDQAQEQADPAPREEEHLEKAFHDPSLLLPREKRAALPPALSQI
jgi:hypothetical protein